MLVAVLGIAVLIVAIVALRHPKRSGTPAGSDTHVSSAVSPSAKSSGSNGSSSSHTSQTSPSGGTSSGSGSSSGAANPAIGSKPLIVLNQSQNSGVADQAAQRFRNGGWTVTDTQDGYANDVLSTTAYYDPTIPGARRAAHALARQYPTIFHRVLERFSELPSGPVVVVLTTDYTP